MKKQVVGALFALSFLFAITFVSAATVAEFADNVRQFFTEFVNSMPEELWIKWLFFFLILTVVFSISELLPFFDEKSFLSFLFSLVVSILAAFFLEPQQVYTALASYKAFGVTLTAIAPFVLLTFISVKCHKKGQVFLSKLLWILFIVSLLWISVDGYFGEGAQPEGSFGWIYPIVLLLSVLMLFIEGQVASLFYKAELKGKLANAETKAQREALLNILSLEQRLGSTTDPEQARILREKIADARKAAGM